MLHDGWLLHVFFPCYFISVLEIIVVETITVDLHVICPVLECKIFWTVQNQSEPPPPSQLWLFLLYLLISLSSYLLPQPLWVPDTNTPAEQIWLWFGKDLFCEELREKKGCPLLNFWLIWEITGPRCLMEKTLELPNVLRAIDFTVHNSAAAHVCFQPPRCVNPAARNLK